MLKKSLLLVTILIIASFFRFYNLAPALCPNCENLMPADGNILPPGLYPDEAINGNNAREALDSKNWKIFYKENFGREGLFINIQSFSVAAFGNNAWALRLPSAIFGVLTVLGLYLLTKKLLPGKNSEILALLASFFLATSFWHINFSRIGFRAIMAPFFLVWALYFLLKSLRDSDSGESAFGRIKVKRFLPYALTAGFFYGLGFYSYIAYRVTPLLLLILGIVYWKNYGPGFKKHLATAFGSFVVSAMITALPLGLYFAKNPQDFFGRTAQISIFDSETPFRDLGFNIVKTLGMFNAVGDFNWRHNVAGRPELFWPVGIFFLFGFYHVSKKALKKRHSMPDIILFSWIIISLLPIIISNEGLPHALRALLIIPPVFILAAIGGLKIYELFKAKLARSWLMGLSAIFLSLLIFEAYYTYFIRWGQNPNIKSAFARNDSVVAEILNSLPKDLPKYVVVRGIQNPVERDNPIFLQSILFLTDTFSKEKEKRKNIHYILPTETEKIPFGSYIINL